MELAFERVLREDIPELTRVMTRAFDDDTQKHLGLEKGGPEGYDNGEFFRKWLFGYEESIGHKAVSEGKIVGAVIVWVFEHGENRVGTIFVDPAYQDRGLGTRMWRFIEATYPQARSWTLGTPSWATKNHYFYEHKCGFRRVGTEPGEDGVGESFIFRKEMGGTPEGGG